MRLIAVCPPNWTIVDGKEFLVPSFSKISNTDSWSIGSKYNLSDVSKSVDTVSGFEFIKIDSIFLFSRDQAAWTEQ